MNKNFKLTAEQIRPLAEGHGACFASDLITVEGLQVGYMYREEPDEEIDSGWRFMSGFETEEYANDPNNLAMYDVNTIANYDRDIIPFLRAPIGSSFERKQGKGPLLEIAEDDL